MVYGDPWTDIDEEEEDHDPNKEACRAHIDHMQVHERLRLVKRELRKYKNREKKISKGKMKKNARDGRNENTTNKTKSRKTAAFLRLMGQNPLLTHPKSLDE